MKATMAVEQQSCDLNLRKTDMFTDEKTLNTINANLDETIIHGTYRYCDLIPAFLDVLKDTPEYTHLITANIPPSVELDDEYNDWWNSDEAFWFYMELHELLEGYAPEGYYFGSHPGDGSDFGFWKSEECDY